MAACLSQLPLLNMLSFFVPLLTYEGPTWGSVTYGQTGSQAAVEKPLKRAPSNLLFPSLLRMRTGGVI